LIIKKKNEEISRKKKKKKLMHIYIIFIFIFNIYHQYKTIYIIFNNAIVQFFLISGVSFWDKTVN
jgi:hypothetical protein